MLATYLGGGCSGLTLEMVRNGDTAQGRRLAYRLAMSVSLESRSIDVAPRCDPHGTLDAMTKRARCNGTQLENTFSRQM